MKTIKLNQMENKIEESELELTKELNTKLDQTVYQLGVIASQKHALLHSLADINKEVEHNKKVLEEKYGQVSINLEDGSYKAIATEQKEG